MKWQYKILTDPREAELNALGADGWELFHAHFEPRGPKIDGNAGGGGGALGVAGGMGPDGGRVGGRVYEPSGCLRALLRKSFD